MLFGLRLGYYLLKSTVPHKVGNKGKGTSGGTWGTGNLRLQGSGGWDDWGFF